MDFPEELYYSKDHEWARVEGNIVIVGITDYAQDALGDIVFLELPPVGTDVEANVPFATIESVKSVSDVYSPVTGKIVEVNDAVIDAPEIINQDPYGEGWMVKIEMNNPDEIKDLISAEEYQKSTAE
ncbi:MAG: glycine cleavage system protein GcvH [Actinobacteria bacterium]|nr:glycine cleavage system protein GcvH [Actinomycetota bacterium]